MTNLNGPTIRDLRRQRGMSVRGLAAAVGISDTMISRYENGLSVPPRDKLRRIAAALGVEVEEDMAWDDTPAAPERGEAPHTYTIVIRTPRADEHILTTTDKGEAHAKYSAMSGGQRLPRVILDGKDLPIYKADKLFLVSNAHKAKPYRTRPKASRPTRLA